MARNTKGLQNGYPITFMYADAAAREAGTGDTLNPIDVGKLALQVDDNTLWMLGDNSPIVWGGPIGGGSGGGSAPNTALLYPFMFTRTVSGGPNFYIEPNGGQPLGQHTSPDGTGDGNEMELEFALAAGSYDVMFIGRKNPGYAILDWYLDEVAFVEGQDWYADPEEGNVKITEAGVTVTGSSHTIKMVVNGKNASSSDFVWGLTAIIFKPAA